MKLEPKTTNFQWVIFRFASSTCPQKTVDISALEWRDRSAGFAARTIFWDNIQSRVPPKQFEPMYTRGYTPATPAVWRGKPVQNRPTTSRSLEDCVIKDSAYYKRKLSMKITQVKAEMFAMNEKIKELNEDDGKIEYRAKQAQAKAKELTELQDLLSDHFTALDKANMRVPKAAIDKETAKLKEENDAAMREQEEMYRSRVHLEQNIEKQKEELSNIMDNTALRNDTKKNEQVKLELQLWKLIQQRERLTDNSMPECRDTSYGTVIESDLGLLRVILCNKLNDMVNTISNASKLEQYQRIISENHMDSIQSCAPRQMLQYLECYLSHLQTIDRYVARASKELAAKYMDVKGMCSNMLSTSSLEDVLGRKITDLKSEISIIKCQCQTSRNKLNTQEADLRANEKQLMGNEQYKKLQELKNKLRNLNGINYSIQEYLEEGRSLKDLHKCKERVLKTINRLNATIISNLNQ